MWFLLCSVCLSTLCSLIGGREVEGGGDVRLAAAGSVHLDEGEGSVKRLAAPIRSARGVSHAYDQTGSETASRRRQRTGRRHAYAQHTHTACLSHMLSGAHVFKHYFFSLHRGEKALLYTEDKSSPANHTAEPRPAPSRCRCYEPALARDHYRDANLSGAGSNGSREVKNRPAMSTNIAPHRAGPRPGEGGGAQGHCGRCK